GIHAVAVRVHRDLRHRRARTDAAHRLHRAGIARPRGVHGGGRIHARVAGLAWLAVPARDHRRRHACGRGRRGPPAACAGRALRVRGIYLAIATMAFGFIVEEVAARWESVTGGNSGLQVAAPSIFGVRFESTAALFYLCLAFAVVATFAVMNLLRSPTGRAFV